MTCNVDIQENFLVGSQNLFWQLSRDGNSRMVSGMSRATTASPKPSFRVPWNRLKKCRIDKVKKKVDIPAKARTAQNSLSQGWKRISAESSVMSPTQPSRSRDWIELNWRRIKLVLVICGLWFRLDMTFAADYIGVKYQKSISQSVDLVCLFVCLFVCFSWGGWWGGGRGRGTHYKTSNPAVALRNVTVFSS